MNNSILPGIFFIVKMIVLTPVCHKNRLCIKKLPPFLSEDGSFAL